MKRVLQVLGVLVAHGLTSHPQACAAVVDLRGNDGGDMGPMVAGVSPQLRRAHRGLCLGEHGHRLPRRALAHAHHGKR